MANTEEVANSNSKNNRKNRKEARQAAWSNFCYKCENVWYNIKRGSKKVLRGIGTAFAVLFILLLLFVSCAIFNPVVVWLLVLIAPRPIVALMNDGLKEPWDVWKAPFEYSKWLYRFVPWRSRKCFIDEACNCSKLTSDDKVRYCGEVEKTFFLKLTAEEKIKVFDTYPDLHDYCVVNGIQLHGKRFEMIVKEGLAFKYALKNDLTSQQWELLLGSKSHANLVYNIIMHKTPSEHVLIMMANRPDYWFEYLIIMLKRHGISKNSINAILKYLSPERQEDVKRALRTHRQVAQIKSVASCWQNDPSGYGDWFKTFLSNEGILEIEAQAAMSVPQYKLYHEMKYKLDSKAAMLILRGGTRDMIEAMFKLEDQHGLYDDEAKELVNLDKDLNDIFLMVLNDKE